MTKTADYAPPCAAARADFEPSADGPRSAPARPRLTVGGWVRHALQFDATQLDALAGSVVSDFEVVCTLDGSHGFLPPVRTVGLRELIERAAPAFERRTDFKRVAIVAEGDAGYRALFSWAEIFNSPLGSGIVVAYERPQTCRFASGPVSDSGPPRGASRTRNSPCGLFLACERLRCPRRRPRNLGSGPSVSCETAAAKLPPHVGPFALLARHDLATGPRFVRGLRSVDVHKLW